MIAENRHYNQVYKKKAHPAAKCRKAKCGICSPHKSVGNSKMATKAKYRQNRRNINTMKTDVIVTA